MISGKVSKIENLQEVEDKFHTISLWLWRMILSTNSNLFTLTAKVSDYIWDWFGPGAALDWNELPDNV